MNKTARDIELEIQQSRQSLPIDRYPQIIECWSEYEKMWRIDNGRSYNHVIQSNQYNYHLLYFDGQLGIVEQSGQTIFSHLTPKLSRMMSGDISELGVPVISEDRHLVKFDELSPDVQKIVKRKHQSFPTDLQNKLDYRSNGNIVWSIETINIFNEYSQLTE
jgi:hypothetical protein